MLEDAGATVDGRVSRWASHVTEVMWGDRSREWRFSGRQATLQEIKEKLEEVRYAIVT